MWLGEDWRRTWFKGLSRKDQIRANKCLLIIESENIDLYQQLLVSKEFNRITGLDADDVLYSFMEYGYCYGNQFIPACMERRP